MGKSMRIKNIFEAQAFCNFLAFERERHQKDIAVITKKLILLREIWNVKPSYDPDDIWVDYEGI